MGQPARKTTARVSGAGPRPAHLRLVSPQARTRTPRAANEAATRSAFLLATAALVVVTALALARVAISAQVAEASIDSIKLRRTIKAERLVADKLELDRSLLITPSRIESEAVGGMQMTKATQVTYISLPAALEQRPDGSPAPDGTGSVPQGTALAGIVRTAAAVTETEARDLLVGDVGLAASR